MSTDNENKQSVAGSMLILNLQSTVSIIKSNQQPVLHSNNLTTSHPLPKTNFNKTAGAVLKILGGYKKSDGGTEPVIVPNKVS